MANPEHVAILKQGVSTWNKWIYQNRNIRPDLVGANLHDAYLGGAYLAFADLSDVNLSGADLAKANLGGAILGRADLSNTNLGDADLGCTILRNVNLRYSHLGGASLYEANLSNSDLSDSDLSDADLKSADLSNADLSSVNLRRVQALAADFGGANLTGACVEDWHINTDTNLGGVLCANVYLKSDVFGRFSERRPSIGNFAPGDFAKLVQKSINTVDFIFRNGVNWEAFVQSFQKLRVQAGSDELDIQTIENKGDGDFVIRVNVPSGADKAKIQECVMEEYGTALKAIESKYRSQLQAKDDQIIQYRQENTNLWEMTKLMASRSIEVVLKKERSMQLVEEQIKILSAIQNDSKSSGKVARELGLQPDLVIYYMKELEKNQYITCRDAGDCDRERNLVAIIEAKGVMAITAPEKVLPSADANVQVRNYDQRGAQFSGGFAETVHGNQYGSTINNYGASLDEITRLITTLREQIQTFPADQKDNALYVLDNIEDDIESDSKKPRDPKKMGRHLKQLMAIVAVLVGGAATVSGDLKTFTGNIIELTKTLGIPIEQVQPAPLPPDDTP